MDEKQTSEKKLLESERQGFLDDALKRIEKVRNVLIDPAINGNIEEDNLRWFMDHLEEAHGSLLSLEENLEIIWNEANEIEQDMQDMADDEIIRCRDTILDRAQKIMKGLHDEIPNQGGN